MDADGQQLGVMSVRDALKIAEQRELDLVEVAPAAAPPVCRIMDFGKYKYQINKKQTAKKTQDVKETKLRPRIDEHDLMLKAKQIRRFLDEGHKAKITMMFRGRERGRPDLGMKVFEKLQELIGGKFVVGQPPKLEGNSITMVLTHK